MPRSSTKHIDRQAVALFFVLLPVVAEAYIGPGAGISFLQGLWIALVGVVLSVVAIVLLPVKMLFRSFGKTRTSLVLLGLGSLVWFAHEFKSPAVPAKVSGRVVVLGFDGMDPHLTERWMQEGLLPNFSRLAESGSYRLLGTTIPAQSPVAWSSFAT
jgi:hypothetical protein